MATKTNSPLPVDLEAGQIYGWCSCGLSETMPLCDRSHRGRSEKKSFKFEVDESKKYYLCACSKSGNPPYCDGSHCKED